MKKTLLAVAAALAASVISSQAQVYSQNIVGYVNLVANTGGATPLSAPLDAVDSFGNTNAATNILQNAYNAGIGNGPLDNSSLIVWTGTKFQTYFFDANTADAAALSQPFTGITDNQGNFVTGPTLGNGKAYYLVYSQISGFAPSNVVTVVGSVRGVNSTTVTNTVVLSSSPVTSYVGSGLPLGGGFLTGLQFTNLLSQGLLDNSSIQIPKVNGQGLASGYNNYYFDSNPADAASLSQTFTGVTDQNGNFIPEPIVNVGGSFIFVNGAGSPVNFTQTLNLQ